jgi:SulP family sulfate permease
VIVFVAGQSSRLVTKRLVFQPDGRVEKAEPPAEVGEDEVFVLQPLGAVLFATADALNAEVPAVTAEPETRWSSCASAAQTTWARP